jgi:hypothetical protein
LLCATGALRVAGGRAEYFVHGFVAWPTIWTSERR